MASFDDLVELPAETWYRVLQQLDIHEMDRLQRCNRFFRKLLNEDDLWKFLYMRRYRFRGHSSTRERYLSHYNMINWHADLDDVDATMRNINRHFSRYHCQPPRLLRMLQILNWDSSLVVDHAQAIAGAEGVDGNIWDTLGDAEEVARSEDIDETDLSEINFNAVLFFVRNHPEQFARIAFKKLDIWNGNDLVLLVLATANKRSEVRCQTTAQQAMLALIKCYPRLIAEHLMKTIYTLETTSRQEDFTSTGIRRLVYEGAHTALQMLFKVVGTQPFVREFSRIDEIGFCILTEITAASENRGNIDVKTLDVLMEYFGVELHRLVGAHIRDVSHPNSFMCLTQTTNTKFIRRFLDYFKEEGQTFVSHFATSVDEQNYEFQQVYAFAKAWC